MRTPSTHDIPTADEKTIRSDWFRSNVVCSQSPAIDRKVLDAACGIVAVNSVGALLYLPRSELAPDGSLLCGLLYYGFSVSGVGVQECLLHLSPEFEVEPKKEFQAGAPARATASAT